MTEPQPRRVLSRRHVVTAALACGALVAAVAGRLLGCEGCDYALFGVPLFAAGAAFYLALGLLALLGAPLRLIGVVSLAGVVAQSGLVRFLASLGVPCPTCIAAAALLFTLSLVCLWPDRRWRIAPGAAALAGYLALPLWSALLVETEPIAGLPEFARSADLRSPPERGTLLVVYEREGCSFCAAFRKDYEPRLAADFGDGLVVRRIDARDRRGLRRVPSFIIRPPDGALVAVRGLPEYRDLAARLKKQ